VELAAAGVAVKTCKVLGYKWVHFEGDAKVVVDAVNREGVDRSRLGHLVADIKAKLRNFDYWKFTFVQRNGNKVAHMLARHAVQQGQNKVWVVPPDCIRDPLLLEHSALSE
jgi:ribonuclease HI